MPDRRSHRGPHPDDDRLFAEAAWSVLRSATADLCWLFSRGYAATSAMKLVGDRHGLTLRQRIAVGRCACSDAEAANRHARRVQPESLAGQPLWIDGYNVLTTIEAALSHGVILSARDGCYRDMASMHGSYRKVAETVPALRLIGEELAKWRVSECRWLLDRPVSNSGRLKTVMGEVANEAGWNWTIELVQNPDSPLSSSPHCVATADSHILNHCRRWVNLARRVIENRIAGARVVELGN